MIVLIVIHSAVICAFTRAFKYTQNRASRGWLMNSIYICERAKEPGETWQMKGMSAEKESLASFTWMLCLLLLNKKNFFSPLHIIFIIIVSWYKTIEDEHSLYLSREFSSVFFRVHAGAHHHRITVSVCRHKVNDVLKNSRERLSSCLNLNCFYHEREALKSQGVDVRL